MPAGPPGRRRAAWTRAAAGSVGVGRGPADDAPSSCFGGSGAAFNEEKAREKVTYELQRVAVLDKVRDQAKITYVDALTPEETARKMGIDVDNLPPEVQLG